LVPCPKATMWNMIWCHRPTRFCQQLSGHRTARGMNKSDTSCQTYISGHKLANQEDRRCLSYPKNYLYTYSHPTAIANEMTCPHL
jgi:hypothetical protein